MGLTRTAIRGFYAILEDAVHLEAVLSGGASVVQLRAKGISSKEFLARAIELHEKIRGRALLIVNDRPDIALLAQAEGVHLGQEDLPIAAARKVVGDLLIGFSTHTCEQALAAEKSGADYIGLGPIFATTTKKNPDPVVGLGQLKRVTATVKIPVVAIGGITPENVASVARAGAAAAVSISGVLGATDIQAAARAVTLVFARDRT